jgi:hypothetical protein
MSTSFIGEWPDGKSGPKVLYVCPEHGRCETQQRARDWDHPDKPFSLCLTCQMLHKKVYCARVEVVPASALRRMAEAVHGLSDDPEHQGHVFAECPNYLCVESRRTLGDGDSVGGPDA